MKKYIAEFVGTFVLVFFAVGTAIVTGDTVAAALAFGLVIVAMAYSVGRVSGCHINPAVSFACLLDKRMSTKDFVGYIVAQILGGLFGGIVLFAIIYMCGYTLGDTAGSNLLIGGDYSVGAVIGSILAEVILTGVFCYTILNVTDEKNTAGKKAGLIIGLTLTLVHLIGIGLTGTSVNPARSIATALCNVFFSGSFESLGQVWVFIVAPMVGAFVAALLYKGLNKEDNANANADADANTNANAEEANTKAEEK